MISNKIIILIFYIIVNIISLIYSIEKNIYNGDLLGFKPLLENKQLILNCFEIIFSYICMYCIFNLLCKVKIQKKIQINTKIYSKIIFFTIIVNIIFYYFTGLGQAGVDNAYKITGIVAIFSYILSKFNLNYLFFIYYCTAKKNNYFWLNFILFTFLQIKKGWIGFLLTVALLEFLKYNKGKLSKIKVLKLSILSLIGSLFYGQILMLRDYIRTGEFSKITYLDSINHFVGRNAFFSNYCYIKENLPSLAISTKQLFPKFHFLYEISYSILPGRMIPFSYSLNSILATKYINPNLKIWSVLTGFLGKLKILFNVDFLEGILFFLVILVLLYINISICKILKREELKNLCFINLFSFLLSGIITELSDFTMSLLIFSFINLIFKRRKK